MKKQFILVITFILILVSFSLFASGETNNEISNTTGQTRNLNSVLYVDRTMGNVTFRVNRDNSVLLSGGPSTSDAYLFSSPWSINNRFLLPAGTYTLSGGLSSGVFVYLTFFPDQQSMDYSREPVYDYGGGKTFSTDKKHYCIVQICVLKNENIDGTTIYPQVEFGPFMNNYVSPWEGNYETKLLTDIQSNVSNLQDQLMEKENVPKHLIVPDYYLKDNYLEKKCETINEYARSCNSLSDTFIFITDIHWTLNAGHSPALLKYIKEHTRIDKLFCGGDVCDFVSSEHQPYDAFTQFYDAWQSPIYTAMGNHEYMTKYGTEGRLYYSFNSVGMNRVGSLKRNYFYVDNPQSMIRYIVLNAFAPDNGNWVYGYEEEQMKWLSDNALDLDQDWGAVIITHMTHDIQNNEISRTEISNRMFSILDNYSGSGEIIAVLSGHTHADYLDYTDKGIPILITTCDKDYPWILNGIDQEPWLSDRIEGTISEQAFDAYIINREEKTITRVRIGAKIHYGIDPLSWTEYEDITISYNH